MKISSLLSLLFGIGASQAYRLFGMGKEQGILLSLLLLASFLLGLWINCLIKKEKK